jgi:hypothetical protein
MSQVFRALGIIFSIDNSIIKRKIERFNGEAVLGFRGKKYIFYYEDGSYILKTSEKVKRIEIESLASIISTTIEMNPICFYDVKEDEEKPTIESTIEWNNKNPDSVISAKLARKGNGKVILYPGTETYLIKVTGINSFNPILFGNPPFKDFFERISKCSELELYLIIDILSRYCSCVNDGTWDGKIYNREMIEKAYELSVLAARRFIEPIDEKVDLESAGQVSHTKKYYEWKEKCGDALVDAERVYLFMLKKSQLIKKKEVLC